MAGDWIKIEKSTSRKPEILMIASELSIHPDHAFGLCFRFWSWIDDHTVDGNARGVTKTLIDALLDRSGFADALVHAGWLRDRNGSLEIPHMDRHLSQSAKKRALTSQRVAKHKSEKGNAKVTLDALPEKRREEDKKYIRPTLQQVKDAGAIIGVTPDQCEEFFNNYEAVNWIDGLGRAITSFQHALGKWKSRNQAKAFEAKSQGSTAKGSSPSLNTPYHCDLVIQENLEAIKRIKADKTKKVLFTDQYDIQRDKLSDDAIAEIKKIEARIAEVRKIKGGISDE